MLGIAELHRGYRRKISLSMIDFINGVNHCVPNFSFRTSDWKRQKIRKIPIAIWMNNLTVEAEIRHTNINYTNICDKFQDSHF